MDDLTYLNLLLDIAYPILVTSQDNFTVKKLNKKMEKLLGFEKEELKYLKLPDILIDEKTGNLQERIKLDVKTGGFLQDYSFKTRAQLEIPVELQIMQLENDLVLIARDLSKERIMEAKIRELTKRSLEANLIKEEFLKNISHEIRTPMNGIIGFADLLNTPNLDETSKTKYLEMINRSSSQLMTILDNLIEMSSLKTNQFTIRESVLSTEEVLKFIYDQYKIYADNKNLEISIYNLAESYSFRGDKEIILKILQNLVNNAIKFTNEGKVTIGSYKDNNFIVFYVEDTGIGINPENAKLIFDSFTQEDSKFSRQYNGLGAGLFIAKNYAELLGGKIELTSEKGRGSTFKLVLPFKEAQEKIETSALENNFEDNKNTEQHVLFPAEKYKKEKTILIAEDEGINFLYMKTLMNNYPVPLKVIHALDGEKAIDRTLENDSIDLIFMDIKMPRVDGIEATRKIKALKKDIPIIILSAYSSEKDISIAMDAGGSDYITKPVTKAKLFEVMGKYLEDNGENINN